KVLDLEHRTTRNTGDLWPAENTQRDHDSTDGAPIAAIGPDVVDDREANQRTQQQRDREEDVSDTRDDGVYESAVEAGHRACGHTDQHDEQRAQEAHQDG